MKRFIMILAVLSALSGCAVFDMAEDAFLADTLCGQTLYYCQDFEKLETESDIINYIGTHISYRKSDAQKASGPEETLRNGYGDCKAYSILYMNIAFFAFGKKYSAGAVDTEGKSVVSGGTVDHCVVIRPDGSMLDPQNGENVDLKLRYRFSFNEIFSF